MIQNNNYIRVKWYKNNCNSLTLNKYKEFFSLYGSNESRQWKINFKIYIIFVNMLVKCINNI